MYTHIAFDVDGTIIDTVQAFTVSLSQTIQALKGEYISPKDLEHFFGVTSKGTVEGVGFEDEEAALSMWEENYVRVYNDTSVPFEGIEDILRTLKQRDKVMGLVTSRCRMEINRDPNLA
ncbi:MAG: HAD hydrolase-like protein, partial [Bacteroidales bacterium]|nr:HAD hydrolase-like protein [Bacteroidales bacterium]